MPTPYNDTTRAVLQAHSDDSKWIAILEASNALSDLKFIVAALVVGLIAALYVWGKFVKNPKSDRTYKNSSTDEIHKITLDVSTLNTEVSELNGDVRVLRGEVSSLDKRFTEYRQDSQDSFNGIFRKLDALLMAVKTSGDSSSANHHP